MSQKVCICGRQQSKDKPLVITITACKNKHPPIDPSNSKSNTDQKSPGEQGGSNLKSPSDKGGKQSSRSNHSHQSHHSASNHSHTEHVNGSKPSLAERQDRSPRSSLDSSSSPHSLTQTTEPLSHSTPHKTADKSSRVTLEEASALSFGKRTPKKSNKSKSSMTDNSKSAFKEGSSPKLSPRTLSFNTNDAEAAAFITAENQVEMDAQSAGNEEEEAEEEAAIDHILFCEEETFVPRGQGEPSDDTVICDLDGYNERGLVVRNPYKMLGPKLHFKDDLRSSLDSKNKEHKGVTAKNRGKDKVFNFPSDVALKLPFLSPRYHGPGCAMEINVLEKHGKKCSYKKMRNPDRNPVDDRVGSYDVIGRIMFKTCQIGTQSPSDTSTSTKAPHRKLAELYSLLHLPMSDNRSFILNASTSDNQVEPVKSLLSGLIVSSKSFPMNFRESRKLEKGKESKENSDDCWINSGTYDVEELYFSNGRANKSVQISSGSQRKWYYFLFPCIFEKSGG